MDRKNRQMPDYLRFKLHDKIAIVGLAQAGAHIILAKFPGPRMEEIHQLRDEIEALGRKALIIIVDMNKVEDCRSLIDQTVAAFSRIEILVNNVSWTGTGDALGVTEDEYGRTFDATEKSVFFASQAAGRIMLAQGGGRTIQIGSNFGEIAFNKRVVYAAAKAAVHHMAKVLSLEWASGGVLVNTVAPCITETESRKNILERPGYKEWATQQMIPRGRWNQPEDLVGAVLFPASDFADMVVGHTLMVDGGWTIH
jgi:2-deoxy-D-gluconate 3-dehydrogenase